MCGVPFEVTCVDSLSPLIYSLPFILAHLHTVTTIHAHVHAHTFTHICTRRHKDASLFDLCVCFAHVTSRAGLLHRHTHTHRITHSRTHIQAHTLPNTDRD